MILLLLLSCGEPVATDTGEKTDPDGLGETETLPMPELSEDEIAALVQDALRLGFEITAQPVWLGAAASLEHAEAGCPDVYAGSSPSFTAGEAGGWSWEDTCATSQGVRYEGYAWWRSEIEVNGTLGGSPPGTAKARRVLTGDAAVSSGTEALFTFEGSAEDTLDIEVGRETLKWSYANDIDASVTGSDAFSPDGGTPNGWRAIGTLNHHGGDDSSDVTIAVDAWFFGPVLEGRMDALSLSISWSKDENGEGCASEPFGSVSVRTPDGYWLDVVFLDAEQGGAGSGACDGCGTLYVRGLETGTVCSDLSFLWTELLTTPDLEDFVFVPRGVGLEGP